MQEKRSGLDDEIDFRALIRSILRAKWWIIGVTLGVAILTFIFTQARAVKTYQVTSMLVFGQAPLNINVLSSTETNFNPSTSALPDTRGITDLATLDSIFAVVYQSPELAASRQQGLTFGKVKQECSLTLSGTNQLVLRVRDPDPKRAILIADLWAQALADRLNTLYGSSNQQVAALVKQSNDARQAWDAAEKALLDYLPKSNVDSLSAQLAQTEAAYNSQLGKVHSIDLILSDGRALNARFGAQPATAPVGTGDAFGLLELQQRAGQVLVCNAQAASSLNVQTGQALPDMAVSSAGQTISCFPSAGVQLQLSGTAALVGPGTVGDAQQELKRLTDSLQAQQNELETGLTDMQGQIALLRAQYESAQSQVDQLTTQRDLAKITYSALSGQISSSQAEVAANGQVARVVGKAGPALLVGGTVLTPTLIAGISALVVAVLFFWLRDWWRSGSEEE